LNNTFATVYVKSIDGKQPTLVLFCSLLFDHSCTGIGKAFKYGSKSEDLPTLILSMIPGIGY